MKNKTGEIITYLCDTNFQDKLDKYGYVHRNPLALQGNKIYGIGIIFKQTYINFIFLQKQYAKIAPIKHCVQILF